MSVHDFYIGLKEHGTLTLAAIAFLMTLIQVVPIKVNPWTALIKWLAKLFNGDLLIQLKETNRKIDNVERKLNEHIEESNAIDLRKRRESILDFASAVAEGKRRHTKEQYEQMLSECDSYLMYCEDKNFKNAVAEESINLIRHTYMQKMMENSFLQTNRYSDYNDNDEDT